MPNNVYIRRIDALIALGANASYISNSDKNALTIAIAAIPAADVEEVEHGDWVEYTNRDGQMACYCSACGSDPGVLYLYRRCPECGAHMSMKLTKEKDSE